VRSTRSTIGVWLMWLTGCVKRSTRLTPRRPRGAVNTVNNQGAVNTVNRLHQAPSKRARSTGIDRSTPPAVQGARSMRSTGIDRSTPPRHPRGRGRCDGHRSLDAPPAAGGGHGRRARP